MPVTGTAQQAYYFGPHSHNEFLQSNTELGFGRVLRRFLASIDDPIDTFVLTESGATDSQFLSMLRGRFKYFWAMLLDSK